MFYDFLWFYHGLIPKPPSDAAPNQGVEGHDVEAEISRTMKQELPSSLPFGVLWDWGVQEKCIKMWDQHILSYSTNSIIQIPYISIIKHENSKMCTEKCAPYHRQQQLR